MIDKGILKRTQNDGRSYFVEYCYNKIKIEDFVELLKD